MAVTRHHDPLLTLYFAEQILTTVHLKEHLYYIFLLVIFLLTHLSVNITISHIYFPYFPIFP